MMLPALLLLAAAPPDPLIDALARCLAIAEPSVRLACLDRDARALVDADRAMPRVAARAAQPAPPPVVEAVDSTLRSATPRGNDRWSLLLADGSRWETAEAWLVSRTLKPGMPVSIRRVTLGGYVLRMAGERSTRVRRVG